MIMRGMHFDLIYTDKGQNRRSAKISTHQHVDQRPIPSATASWSSFAQKSVRLANRHSRMLLAGIQPHGNPAVARVWIPAKSMRE
jgi:hypothetical protein